MTKPFAKAIAVVAFALDPSLRASYRLAIASSALCTGLLLTSVANAAYILLGEGYVPKPHDTYVPADAGACCIGEASNFTNVYLAQTFKATGRRPESILLGLNEQHWCAVPIPPSLH